MTQDNANQHLSSSYRGDFFFFERTHLGRLSASLCSEYALYCRLSVSSVYPLYCERYVLASISVSVWLSAVQQRVSSLTSWYTRFTCLRTTVKPAISLIRCLCDRVSPRVRKSVAVCLCTTSFLVDLCTRGSSALSQFSFRMPWMILNGTPGVRGAALCISCAGFARNYARQFGLKYRIPRLLCCRGYHES